MMPNRNARSQNSTWTVLLVFYVLVLVSGAVGTSVIVIGHLGEEARWPAAKPLLVVTPIAWIIGLVMIRSLRARGRKIGPGLLVFGGWLTLAIASLLIAQANVKGPASIRISGDPAPNALPVEGYPLFNNLAIAQLGQTVSWGDLSVRLVTAAVGGKVDELPDPKPGEIYLMTELEITSKTGFPSNYTGRSDIIRDIPGSIGLRPVAEILRGSIPTYIDPAYREIDGMWVAVPEFYRPDAPIPNQMERYRLIFSVPTSLQDLYLIFDTGEYSSCDRDVFISGEHQCHWVSFIWSLPAAANYPLITDLA